MIVYEFYLKASEQASETKTFEVLSDGFLKIGSAMLRKVDGSMGSAAYSISRNLATHWVQILVDDNTPQGIITALEARINGLCDTPFVKYTDPNDRVAPIEKVKVVAEKAVAEIDVKSLILDLCLKE